MIQEDHRFAVTNKDRRPGANTMFQNRHSGGSHSQMKLPAIPEYLDRLREEYTLLQQQVQSFRVDAEKKSQELEGLQRQMMGYMEFITQAHFEMVKSTEASKRLAAFLQQIIPMLPAEHQAPAIQTLERAKNVTPQEVMQAMQQQPLGMPMMANLAGSNLIPPGFNPFFKPEDMNTFAALMSKGGFPFMPPVAHPLLAGMAGIQASTSQAQHNGPTSSHNFNNDTHRSSVRSTSRANSRPQSSASTPAPKRVKTDVEETTDGELEIDVQNDDGSAGVSMPKAGTNGPNNRAKSGRESTHSVSSRDSSTTPKPNRSGNSAFHNNMPLGDLNQLFNQRPLLLDSARMFGSMGMAGNGKPPYAFKVTDGGPAQPVQFPTDAFEGSDVPKSMNKLSDLSHEDVVCAVTVAPVGEKVYTGGKGCVKVWDISRPKEVTKALSTLNCLSDQYIRSCKLLPDNSTLLVGGECKDICVLDVNSEKVVKTLDCEAQACYALVISSDGRQCYCCCADGKIVIWDMVSYSKIGEMKGHEDGASCVDLTSSGSTLWTGGLDNTVCSWDLAQRSCIKKFDFDTQVFSLSCSPTDDWVAVGMENSKVELVSGSVQSKYILHEHESCVLSLKFAHSGKWFVSTGKDSSLITWRAPYGARLVKTKQETSVLSCDISHDDKYIVTGAGDKKAVLYEVVY